MSPTEILEDFGPGGAVVTDRPSTWSTEPIFHSTILILLAESFCGGFGLGDLEKGTFGRKCPSQGHLDAGLQVPATTCRSLLASQRKSDLTEGTFTRKCPASGHLQTRLKRGTSNETQVRWVRPTSPPIIAIGVLMIGILMLWPLETHPLSGGSRQVVRVTGSQNAVTQVHQF